MAVCDVVIVGSYPPMPGPATAASLAAVRRAWDEGLTVRVVSYRTGAADITVPVAGPLAGWRLEQVRRHYDGPRHLVLVLQSGAPYCAMGPAEQLATTAGLVVAFRRFSRVTVVVGEDPGLVPACFRAVVRAADECMVATEYAARALQERYNLRPGMLLVEEVEDYPAFPPGAEVATGGLYRPGAARGLTMVELPATTTAQRALARLRASTPRLFRLTRGR